MGLKIETGIQKGYTRVVLYGVEGIGKSTFASMLPNPLFIDIEHGTRNLNVNRVKPHTYSELLQVIAELKADNQGFKTLVIDTADWMESMICEHIVDSAGEKINSIEDFGYGKGWVKVEETWRKVLDKLNCLKMNIILLAHCEIKKFEQPDEKGAYDRYTLKLSKKGSAVLKEFPEALLFANYKTMVQQDENGKAHASGQKRVIYTTHHASWDAKNREVNMPECIPMHKDKVDEKIMSMFMNETQSAPSKPQQAKKEPESKPEPKQEETPERFDKLKSLMDMAIVTYSDIENFLIKVGAYPAGTSYKNFSDSTLNKLVNEWEAVLPQIKDARTDSLSEAKEPTPLEKLEQLMERDNVTSEELEKEVSSKGQATGSYTEYSVELINKLTGAWALVSKAIKEA